MYRNKTMLLALGAALLAALHLYRRLGIGERPKGEVGARRRHPFDVFDGHEYVRLTTFRTTGEPVHTPVWFARLDGRLYVTTDPWSGKMKRIRKDERVILTPCTAWNTPIGESVGARGRPFDDDGGGERVLKEKYGWKMWLFRRLEREDFVGRATLELRPASEPA